VSNRWQLFILVLFFFPAVASAEGACPPGQYPIGGQGVQGCAPIQTGSSGAASSAPRPSGKWETRWGAVAEGRGSSGPDAPTATGVSVSQPSKKLATSVALDECKRGGGLECKIRIAYHNQCVAIADPIASERARGATMSSVVGAETLSKASKMAQDRCGSRGASCEIFYSACSMSEFKAF